MREFFLLLFGSGSRKMLILVCSLSLISGIASAVLIAFVGQIFSTIDVLNSKTLFKNAGVLAILVVVSLSLDIVAKWYLSKYSVSRHRQLHIAFSNKVLNDSLRHTETTGMARLITIYTEDMSLVGAGLNVFATVSVSFFVVLGCLAYLVYISTSLMLLTLLIGLVAAMGYYFIHRHSTLLARKAFTYRDRHVSLFKNMVHGIAELKLNYKKRFTFVNDQYLPTVKQHETRYLQFILAHLVANTWFQFIIYVILAAVLLYMAFTDLSTEIVGPFVVVALFMKSHVTGLISAVPVWSRAGVALQRIKSQGYEKFHVDQELQPTDPKNLFFSNDPSQELLINIENLIWNYTSEMDDRKFSVGPVSLTLKSGELVFLVGHNGAGKTTFAKLVSGLYECEQGRVVCNNVEVNESNISSYRELFSVIFSDPFIFDHLTVADEKGLDDNEFAHMTKLLESDGVSQSERRIQHYLEKLQLHHKVKVENEILSTTSLSGGQRKRLALLSAYLENKPIMIFDEWAENQDPGFKNIFYNELLPELRSRGKLIVVISHESQYFHVADKQITLDSRSTGATQIVSNT